MENLREVTPAAHFPINIGSELLVEIVSLNLRIKSLLVGMDEGRFILVKLSPNDLMGTFRSETVRESAVNVNYMHKGVVYGFKAEILNIVSTPSKLIFISYPKTILEQKVVTTSRHECILPAVTMFGNELVEMVILDISKEGCRCAIKPPPKDEYLFNLIQVNKKMEIKAQFPGSAEKIALVGTIRNISKDPDKIVVGVMFEKMPEEVKAKLDKFISLILSIGRKG
ncbi:MAG: flagellar brake protein [Deltaproteobacteria bacterium]|nr:flagellar brake protein [Deltaproteobacteria bacterium]